jgi:DNA repair exonuclease SbcCD ATPase subunit
MFEVPMTSPQLATTIAPLVSYAQSGITPYLTMVQQPMAESSEQLTRDYTIPEGKREALWDLMSREDVPVLVSQTEDGIQVHGTARQQAIFAAFLNMIHPGAAPEIDFAPLGGVVIDQPYAVAMPHFDVTLNAQAGAFEAALADLMGRAEALAAQAEELASRAQELEAEGDDLEEQAEQIDSDAEELQGEARAAARARVRELQARARDLRREASQVESQAESMAEHAEQVAEEIQSLEEARAEAEEAAAQADEASDDCDEGCDESCEGCDGDCGDCCDDADEAGDDEGDDDGDEKDDKDGGKIDT